METGVSQVQTGETPRPSTPTAGALSAPQSSRYEVRHCWKAFTPMLVEEGDLAVNPSVLISSRVVQLPFSPDRPSPVKAEQN